ncbi:MULTISPECIES: type II secretion system protein N [unclassified Moraxella]|uniref:type II secretion system protein N n=1 Tax=unclassified Moraxella TaxID=2685852 RepID=UPI003AF4F374
MKNKRSLSSNATAVNLTKLFDAFSPWLLLVAIVCLVWLIAKAFWLVVAPPRPPALPPVPMQASANSQLVMGNGLDMFAKPMAQQAPTVPPPDIKVLGVTQAVPNSLSFAIINSGGKTQSYRVGAMIEGSNYTLAQVNADHIMIADPSGQTIKIEFGKPFSLDQSDAIRAKNQPPSQATAMDTSVAPSFSGLENGSPSPQPSGNMVGEDRENPFISQPNSIQPTPSPANNQAEGAKNALGTAVNGLQQNPNGYLSQMGVAATGNGYLVTDGMPAGLKNRLGLQTGDKVLSVNGQSVGQNPAQDAQLLQQVQQAGQAQIQVQRGEQTVTVRQSF